MKRYKCGQFLYYYDETSNSIKSYIINSIGKNAKGKVYWIFQDSLNHVTADLWPKIDFAYSTQVCELPDRLYFKSYNKAYKYYEDTIHYNELKIIVDDLRQQFAKIETKYGEKLKFDSNYTIKLSDNEIKTDLYIKGFGSATEKLEELDKEVASLKAKVEAKNKKRKSKSKKESSEARVEQEKVEDKKDPENEDMSRVSK